MEAGEGERFDSVIEAGDAAPVARGGRRGGVPVLEGSEWIVEGEFEGG